MRLAPRARRSRPALAAGFAASAMLVAVVSCSLGLDESKITEGSEGGIIDTGTPEEASVDAGDGGTIPTGPDGGSCSKDDECPTGGNACLKARCDLAAKRCIYDVCRPMACNVGVCDTAAKTCGAPKAYTYKVTQFQVGLPVQRVVAVYPWLFVLTQAGVTAYNISNPFGAMPNSAPPSTPVFGIGFAPTQMAQTGNRVFFLIAPTGPANMPSRLPIAWLDVPTDPLATRLDAKNAVVTYSRAASEPVSMIGRENDTALLFGAAAQSFPSAIVQPPLTEPASLTATPIVFTAGQNIAAISGERLLFQQIDGNGSTTFGLVKGAGSTTPMNAGVYSYADAGPYGGPQNFAGSVEGALYWQISSFTASPADPNGFATRAVRGHFLFANGAADYDRPATFDVEVYTPVPGAPHMAGPAAMLDSETAMVLTAAKENVGAQTAVQFVKKNPLGVVKEADGTTPRRLVLGVPVNTFAGAAAAGGLGFAVANESMPGPNATVYVFDPNCPSK